MGFLVSLVFVVIDFLTFLLGTSRYMYVKPCGNPMVRVAQVFVVVVRK